MPGGRGSEEHSTKIETQPFNSANDPSSSHLSCCVDGRADDPWE
jgi:hypothetical protein